MTTWMSLDLFNLIQITGIVLALLFAIALEVSNRKLHSDNQRRNEQDDLADTPVDQMPLKAHVDAN